MRQINYRGYVPGVEDSVDPDQVFMAQMGEHDRLGKLAAVLMANVIEQLHVDHVNMARLLDFIDEEIDKLIDGKQPDFLMLEHAMRYMISYPDVFHHPREEALFALLVERDPEARQAVTATTREHQRLHDKGEQFYGLVREAESAGFVRRDEVIAKGTDYVQTLRNHMDREEGDLLRRARRCLTEEDLATVADAVETRHDPLFGDTVAHSYADLYHFIVNQHDTPAD